MNRTYLLFACLFLLSCSPAFQGSTPATFAAKKPKNIILMIGDGMGLSQITAAMYSDSARLNLERCPVVGLIKTHAGNRLITDSAAGATAYATGKKTYVGGIGVDLDTLPATNIMELAHSNGLATGLVVSCVLTDATPASFYAHRASRRDQEILAWDLSRSDIDLLIGGGQRYFEERRDGDNLLFVLKVQGYTIRNTSSALGSLNVPDYKKLAYFTAAEQPTTYAKGRNYLPQAASFAPDFLKARSDQGFFLMVEGSQIDKGGHANSAPYVVSELRDFDRAIGKILDFAEEDGETLVIILADHETGGLALKQANDWERNDYEPNFATGGHTASMVPVFAFGPGSQAFAGIQDNTEIFFKMKRALSLE